jgi:two-component system, NarL family, sensor histidine kinase DesK
MVWAPRLGKVLALACLVVLWPLASLYLYAKLPAFQMAALTADLVIYSAVYAWYCFAGYRSRSAAVPVTVAAALTLLALGLNHLSGFATVYPFLIPIMVAGFGLRPLRALLAILLLTTVTLADSVPQLHLRSQEAVGVGLLFLPQLLLLGVGAMGLRYLLGILAELRAAREQIARLAAEEERARISRDLHDLLGQSLSLMTLKGELAGRLMGPDAKGAEEVREMVRLAREALREVRETVSGYRQPTLATELAAARTALAAAGVQVDVGQGAGALDRETEALLGWVVREGATNVIRHGRSRHCNIQMTRTNRAVRVDVTNDGERLEAAAPGNGLRGLQERMSGRGGQVEATPLPDGGFRLRVTVPLEDRTAPGRNPAAEVVAPPR